MGHESDNNNERRRYLLRKMDFFHHYSEEPLMSGTQTKKQMHTTVIISEPIFQLISPTTGISTDMEYQLKTVSEEIISAWPEKNNADNAATITLNDQRR